MEENTEAKNLRDSVSQKVYGQMPKSFVSRVTGDFDTNDDEDSREYKAWGFLSGENRQISLSVRFGRDASEVIAYNHFPRIKRESHTNIDLLCSSCIFTIEGKNLAKLEELLAERKVKYIQEWSAKRFDKPDGREPIITKIDVVEIKEIHEGGISSSEQNKPTHHRN